MKITRIEPPQAEQPALAEVHEPPADDSALAGTRALVAELHGRLETVTAQAAAHRQGAEQPFAGSPDALPAHLEAVEQHRADAARLAIEAETLQRQIHVAEQLLNRLESEQAEREAAATQAIGRKLLAAALERYTLAAAELGDAVLNMGACSILANQPSSFAASVRALLLPDLSALGAALPALPGFRRQREGQTVATSDLAFSQRANELLRNEETNHA